MASAEPLAPAQGAGLNKPALIFKGTVACDKLCDIVVNISSSLQNRQDTARTQEGLNHEYFFQGVVTLTGGGSFTASTGSLEIVLGTFALLYWTNYQRCFQR